MNVRSVEHSYQMTELVVISRVRQTCIKRAALEIMERFPDKLGGSFEMNREFIRSVMNGNKRLINRISGYTVRLYNKKKKNAESITKGYV